MSKCRFEIRAMVEEDREVVARLVAKCYSEKESVTKHIGESSDECYRYYAKPVGDSILLNLSFVCVDHCHENGDEIIACHLCKEVQTEAIKGDVTDIGQAFEVLNNEFKRRYLELHEQEKGAIHVSHECICVQDGYENKGIATQMTNVTLGNAKRLGYKYFFIMPTVNGMLHIVKEKMRMKKLFGMRYDDIELNGVRYFKGITEPDSYDAYELNLWDFHRETAHVLFN